MITEGHARQVQTKTHWLSSETHMAIYYDDDNTHIINYSNNENEEEDAKKKIITHSLSGDLHNSMALRALNILASTQFDCKVISTCLIGNDVVCANVIPPLNKSINVTNGRCLLIILLPTYLHRSKRCTMATISWNMLRMQFRHQSIHCMHLN